MLNKILEQLLAIIKAKVGEPPPVDDKCEELENKLEALNRRIKVLEEERNEALDIAKQIREVVDKWEN